MQRFSRRSGAGLAVLLALGGALAGCDDEGGRRPVALVGRDSTGGIATITAVQPSGAALVGMITELHAPESVRYDDELDVFYISNIRLYGSEKDDNGFIVRADAGDPRRSRVLVDGADPAVTLHAPKGMALHGDTLWVADIDVLRGFHRVSGAPLATIDFAAHGPRLLNDVAIGPDGSIRVTDTGIVMSQYGVIFDTTGSRIFAIGPGRAITVEPATRPLPHPNGITWDARGNRWLVATFGPFTSGLYATTPGDTARTILAQGTGKWDGVEILDDGRILVSSWSDSSVHVLDGGRHAQLVRAVPEPADIGVDKRRGRLAIPLAFLNRVELWSIPPRAAAARRS